jgi:hypothetical protein
MEGDKKEAAKVRFKELYAQCLEELKDPNLAAAEAMKRVQAEMAGVSTPAKASESVSKAAEERKAAAAAPAAAPAPEASPAVAAPRDPLEDTELGAYVAQVSANPEHVERVVGRRNPAAAAPAAAAKPAAATAYPLSSGNSAVPPAAPFPAMPTSSAWTLQTFGRQVRSLGLNLKDWMVFEQFLRQVAQPKLSKLRGYA